MNERRFAALRNGLAVPRARIPDQARRVADPDRPWAGSRRRFVRRDHRSDRLERVDERRIAEVEAIRADLRGWLQQKSLREPDWAPEFYELSFGLRDPGGHDARSRKEPVGICSGYQLQGSIDLVERHSSGILRVVDHKTGKIPEPLVFFESV